MKKCFICENRFCVKAYCLLLDVTSVEEPSNFKRFFLTNSENKKVIVNICDNCLNKKYFDFGLGR